MPNVINPMNDNGNKTVLNEPTTTYQHAKLRYRVVYDRKNEHKAQNLIQIEIYNAVTKKRAFLTTGVHVCEHEFDQKARCVVNRGGADELNRFIYQMISDIEQIELELWYRKKQVTMKNIRDQYLAGYRVKNVNLYKFCEDIIANGDRKEGTNHNLTTALKLFTQFDPQLSFDKLDCEYLHSFQQWLLEKMNFKPNTVVKNMICIRTFVNAAIKEGYLRKGDYFSKVSFKSERTRDESLTADEVEMIEKYRDKVTDTKKRMILDRFLLGCYTGLRFSDLVSLKDENIIVKKDKKKKTTTVRIEKRQVKTGKKVTIPITHLFNGKAVKMLTSEPYKGNIEVLTKSASNSSDNKYLSEVGEKLGIEPHVTYHLARHIFTSILVSKGITPTFVSQMLGHSSLRMTETYTTFLPDEMEKQLMALSK